MSSSALRRYFSGFSKNTLLLTGVGLLADISTEMLSPILPVFLTQTLKANGSIVGLVDGVAQATRNVVDGFSGAVSDKLQRRKLIAVIGFGLSAVAKPLMGVSSIWEGVLGARLLDRFGAGIRSAPRDALVASSVPADKRGGGFGAEGLGDNAGAFFGPLLALLLLYFLAVDLRTIFYLAVIPGLLAFTVVLFVKEKDAAPGAQEHVQVSPRQLPRAYWRYLLVIGLFGLGNSSDSFLILRTQDLGASVPASILIYAGSNLTAALASVPAGFLSDRWGRKRVLLASFLVFAVVYAGFGLSNDLSVAAGLFVFYGLYQGMFRTAGKALASDFVPARLRASGIGWYSMAVGLLQLAASLIAGALWDNVGHAAAFQYGAALAAGAGVALIALRPPRLPTPARP